MESSKELRVSKVSMGRWFGVVRRKNGKFYYGFDWVLDSPTQTSFFRSKLKLEGGDNVVEVFKSNTLEPDDFISYYKEFYLLESPMITQFIKM